jgi:hypothetical protein
MKLRIILGLLFTVINWTEGATIIRVEGVIEEQLLGDWPDVGTPYVFTINYDVTALTPVEDSATEIDYFFNGHSSMILGGEEYFLDLTMIDLTLGVNGVETVDFVAQSSLIGPGVYGAGVSFSGPIGFVDDPRRLPSSLDEWELDEADFSLYFDYNDENGFILASSTSYSHLSITTIPEPSSLSIMALGIILPVLRRRREE